MPQKNTQKHVFWGLPKNIEKHQGAGRGGVGDWDLRGGKRSRESGETRRTMSALNPDRASRQRDIAIGAAVFEGPAVTLASNAGAPAAAPLASNQPAQAAACAPAALTALTVSRTAHKQRTGHARAALHARQTLEPFPPRFRERKLRQKKMNLPLPCRKSRLCSSSCPCEKPGSTWRSTLSEVFALPCEKLYI